MKKNIAVCIAMFSICLSAFAQSNNGGLSGTITDSISKQALPNAGLKLTCLKDGKIISGITDNKGGFKFNELSYGAYSFLVAYVGYQSFKIDTILFNEAHPSVTLPPISLQLEQKDLKAVTVHASKPFIVQTADKITLNVAQSPIAAGGNAYDVLLRAPGIVEQNGSLNLSGKSVNVLINGRYTNLSGEELKNMLTNMPANGIDKVEIISNPSSRYDAQGGSIINIRLAKNQNFGMNGTVTAGMGTGRFAKYNTGLSLNYRNKHLNLYGSYDYMHNQQYYDNFSDRLLATGGAITEHEYDVRKRYNHAYKMGLDYDISKRSSFGVLFRGSSNFRDRAVHNQSVLSGKTGGDSSSTVATSGYARFFNPSVNLYFKTTLDAAGKKELVINADYFNYNKQWSDDFITRYFTASGSEYLPPLLLHDNSPADNTIKSITIDYTQPSKIGKWEAGVKTTFTVTDNNVLWQQQIGGEWNTDATKTNHFIYRENINAAYVNFSKTIKKVGLQLGLRAEQTNTEGQSFTLKETDNKSYLNLFPNISLQYNQLKQQFGLSYRKSIERFGFDYVNPFIIYQSQYSYSQGNPNIEPMIAHSFELSHAYKYQYFTKLGYTRLVNVLGPLYRQDPATNAVISSYGNLSTADVYSASVTMVKNLFKGKWGLMNTAGAFYSKYNGASYGNNPVNAKVTGFISSNSTIALPKKIKAEVSLYYFSPIASGVYQQRSMFSTSVGFFKAVLKSKGSLALNVSDIFNTQKIRNDVLYQGINIHYNNKAESRFVNLVFTYKFGNTKVKTSKSRKTGIEDEKSRMGAN